MKRTAYIAIAVVGLILFLLPPLAMYKFYSKNCPGELISVVVRDSIVYRDTSYHQEAKVSFPKNFRVGKISRSFTAVDSVVNTNAIVYQCVNFADTFFYQKEIRQADFFKVKLDFGIADNRIVTWNEAFADLRRDTIKIVERNFIKQPKTSLLKGFLGLHGSYGNSILRGANIDAGPSAALLFADRYLVNYDYSVRNNFHQLGFLVKLQFKK